MNNNIVVTEQINSYCVMCELNSMVIVYNVNESMKITLCDNCYKTIKPLLLTKVLNNNKQLAKVLYEVTTEEVVVDCDPCSFDSPQKIKMPLSLCVKEFLYANL